MNPTSNQAVQWLEEFAEKHALTQKAISGCHKVVSHLIDEDDVDGILFRSLEVESIRCCVVGTALHFGVRGVDGVFVSVNIDVENDDEEVIASYEMIFNVEGKYVDEYFVMRQNLIREVVVK